MKIRPLFTILAISTLFSGAINAQSTTDNFGIKFTGYVKTDFYYDTRQNVSARESQFLLYPENIKLDPNGNDINDAATFHILSIQSRLRGNISGPDIWGGKTSGAIEAEFLGVTNVDINGFRLRHAYSKINWTKTELLMGQYWNPMFVPEVYTLTPSSNAGAPFQPFARNPQIRITQNIGNLKLIGVALSQRDFMSNGYLGASTDYSRNAAMPTFHAQFQFSPDSSKHLFGIGAEYKTLKPQNVTEIKNYKSTTTVESLSYMAFAKLEFNKFSIKAQLNYIANSYDMSMIGGYAATSIDTATNIKSWTPLYTASAWSEIAYKMGDFTPALFIGYTENMGAQSNILNAYNYARHKDLAYVYRVAPRLSYQKAKVLAQLELEYTVAAYGKTNEKGIVSDAKEVTNIRPYLSVFYIF